MGSADVITSPGKHAEGGFFTATKECDVGAVKSSEYKKIGNKSRTLCTGCVLYHFLLFPVGSKLKLYLFHVTPRKSRCANFRTP